MAVRPDRDLERRRVQAPTGFFFEARIAGLALVAERDADDSNIAGVVIFLVRVRFANRAETKGSDLFPALPKAFHFEFFVRHDNVSAFAQRSFAAVDYVQSVDGHDR